LDTTSGLQTGILVVLLILSGFFSSAETALTTVNAIQIQLLADEGSKGAKRVLWILDRSNDMLSAILIGNNIVNISASALLTTLTIKLFGNVYVGLMTGVLTVTVLIFGEIVPKSIAAGNALKLSIAYSWVIVFLMRVLKPIIFLVEKIRRGICAVLHIDADAKGVAMTEDELKTLVDVGLEEGAIENDEFEMITNVFSLDDSLAKDIMVPRIDMEFVPLDASYDELMEIYEENKYTRYPVYNESTDTVIGTINMKDLLLLSEEEKAEFHIGKIMREPHFTFEHKEVGTLLMEMKAEALSIVIVLDEYGATSGLVTLEDILEEIVGEIRDEYDKDERDSIIPLRGEGEYLIEGSTNLDDINEKLRTEFESEEYDSIGGYLIEYLDRLPKSGEKIVLENGTKLIAEVVKRNRVEKVHLFLTETEGEKDA